MGTIPVSLVNANAITFVLCTFLTNLTLVSVCCVKINRLPSETQEQLKKMSTARLAAKLGRAGYNPDRLEDLEKAELLEAIAETMLAEPTAELETDFFRKAREASQVSLLAGDSSSATSDKRSAALRLRELELEQRRLELEKTSKDFLWRSKKGEGPWRSRRES